MASIGDFETFASRLCEHQTSMCSGWLPAD